MVVPSNPADAKGLLLSAIDDPNPVIFLEHKLLYKIPGRDPVPEGATRIPLGVSKVVREGKDLTIVATGIMVNKCYEVAEKLAAEGITITLIDPRTISPLDMNPVYESVEFVQNLLEPDHDQESCTTTYAPKRLLGLDHQLQITTSP